MRLMSFVFLVLSICIQLGLCNLICRQCGHSITNSAALKNVWTPSALYNYNMTILGKETMVQVLKNPADETFHVISVNGAELKFAGQSYNSDTWFPGFKWTTCVCSKCGHHMGWYFESEKENFIGLVLDYVVSSHHADSILRVPKS